MKSVDQVGLRLLLSGPQTSSSQVVLLLVWLINLCRIQTNLHLAGNNALQESSNIGAEGAASSGFALQVLASAYGNYGARSLSSLQVISLSCMMPEIPAVQARLCEAELMSCLAMACPRYHIFEALVCCLVCLTMSIQGPKHAESTEIRSQCWSACCREAGKLHYWEIVAFSDTFCSNGHDLQEICAAATQLRILMNFAEVRLV